MAAHGKEAVEDGRRTSGITMVVEENGTAGDESGAAGADTAVQQNGTAGDGSGNTGDGSGGTDTGSTGADAGNTEDAGNTGDTGNTGAPGGDRDFPQIGDGSLLPDNPWKDGIQVDLGVDVGSYMDALQRFGESSSGHLSNATAATTEKGGSISNDLNILDSELEAAGNQLQRLTQILGQGVGNTSSNVDALMNQAQVLRRSITSLRDDLFRYEGISVEDVSDETDGADPEGTGLEGAEGAEGAEADAAQEGYYDTSSFQQGKITLCINRGRVEADTNVGGITGQIATEVDFDPEEDITFTGTESFHIEQTVKAVIRESRNLGDVTGKKNYVGGIVGKADFGAVISCESYAAADSTGGDYVGGIAGSSDYCIRSCYSMGPLSGKDYVGGIAGRGSVIFCSYAYPEIDYSGEYAGSIAGYVREDGTLYGNYYVKGNVPGVDSIGYEGGATPLDYAEFCSMEHVPEAFSEFTVSFVADGQELASFRCPYGGSLDRAQIPGIPEKEGYYGVWPEFDYDHVTSSKVLEAQYEKWITSLAGEKDAEGRTKVLVQGEFRPEAELKVEENDDGSMRISIPLTDENGGITGTYESPVTVRVLCEDAENASAEVETADGYRRVSCQAMGSYLEFSMEKPGNFRIMEEEKGVPKTAIALCAAAAAAVILGLLLLKRFKRRKKAAPDDTIDGDKADTMEEPETKE